jgi:hypothetical protein
MRRWLTVLLAVVVIAALGIAAGCGGKSSTSSPSGSPTSQELTAQQIFEKGMAASSAVKSQSFTLDASLGIKGDPSKAPDAQTKALMQAPVTVKAQGSLANEPQKMDMTMNLAAAGQTFDLGLKVDGSKMWVQVMKDWYVVPEGTLSGITGASPAPSASPGGLTQQLQGLIKQLGVDPTAWTKEWKLVGTETLDGTEVYHLQQVLDAGKMVDDLMKLSGSLGALTGGLGASASPGTQQSLDQAAKVLKESMKDVSVDWYFEKDNYYLRKMQVGGTIDFSGNADAQKQGLASIDYNLGLTTGDFDKPVTVTPPANPKPFDQLLNSLMGSGGISL